MNQPQMDDCDRELSQRLSYMGPYMDIGLDTRLNEFIIRGCITAFFEHPKRIQITQLLRGGVQWSAAQHKLTVMGL